MQVKKQQLEPDMDWFEIGRVHQGCILSPCLFNLYAEYVMWNARMVEAQAGIKIARRNIDILRYADDTTNGRKQKRTKETLESPLDSKVMKLVSPKGNQPWIFIGRTNAKAEGPVFWPPDSKTWLTEKDPDAGKDWGQKERRMTEDKMVGWHHQVYRCEF